MKVDGTTEEAWVSADLPLDGEQRSGALHSPVEQREDGEDLEVKTAKSLTEASAHARSAEVILPP